MQRHEKIFIFSTAVLMQSDLCKPYIEVWKLGLWTDGLLDSCELWTVGSFDYYKC